MVFLDDEGLDVAITWYVKTVILVVESILFCHTFGYFEFAGECLDSFDLVRGVDHGNA